MTTPTKDTLIQKLQGYGISQVVEEIDPLSIEDLIAFVEKDWTDLGCSLAIAKAIYNHLHPQSQAPPTTALLPVPPLPHFNPINYAFTLYGLDSNGDAFLPLQGRTEQVKLARQYIRMPLQKLSPIIISTSRGMGKTFLLKKLGANDLASNERIDELEQAKLNGRTISVTAAPDTVDKYDKNYELWVKDLLLAHLSHVFAGYSYQNVDFRIQPYLNPLLDDLSYASDSFKTFVELVRSFSVSQAFDLVMEWTRNAFNITAEIRLVILVDEMQHLLLEMGIQSTIGTSIHTFLSMALSCLKSKRPIIIMTGTNYGEHEIMDDYSDVNPHFVGLTPFALEESRDFGTRLFGHAGKQINWSADDLRLAQAIQTLSAGVPRLLRLGYGSWMDLHTASFQLIIQTFFVNARSYYKEAAAIFGKDSMLSDTDLAMIMLCCNSFYPVSNINNRVSGTKHTWNSLIRTSVVFPCGNDCYCIPSIFWLPKDAEVVADKMARVNSEISRLVHGVELGIMNLDVIAWYDDRNHWLTHIGHYFERLFGMSLAISYYLQYKRSRKRGMKLSDVYYVPENSYFRPGLDSLDVNLKDGFEMCKTEELPDKRKGRVKVVYCNQKAKSTAKYDSVIQMAKGYICIQNKNSYKTPAACDIVKQLDALPSDSVLIWVYLGHNDKDMKAPLYYDEIVKDAIKKHKLIFVSSAGCCSPAILSLLSNLMGRVASHPSM